MIKHNHKRIILVIPPTGMEEWTKAVLLSAHQRLAKKGVEWTETDLIRSLSTQEG